MHSSSQQQQHDDVVLSVGYFVAIDVLHIFLCVVFFSGDVIFLKRKPFLNVVKYSEKIAVFED